MTKLWLKNGLSAMVEITQEQAEEYEAYYAALVAIATTDTHDAIFHPDRPVMIAKATLAKYGGKDAA